VDGLEERGGRGDAVGIGRVVGRGGGGEAGAELHQEGVDQLQLGVAALGAGGGTADVREDAAQLGGEVIGQALGAFVGGQIAEGADGGGGGGEIPGEGVGDEAVVEAGGEGHGGENGGEEAASPISDLALREANLCPGRVADVYGKQWRY
jgi:hypothetical protein